MSFDRQLDRDKSAARRRALGINYPSQARLLTRPRGHGGVDPRASAGEAIPQFHSAGYPSLKIYTRQDI